MYGAEAAGARPPRCPRPPADPSSDSKPEPKPGRSRERKAEKKAARAKARKERSGEAPGQGGETAEAKDEERRRRRRHRKDVRGKQSPKKDKAKVSMVGLFGDDEVDANEQRRAAEMRAQWISRQAEEERDRAEFDAATKRAEVGSPL